MDKSVHLLFLILLHTTIENNEGCYCDHYPWTAWSSCSKTCNSGTQRRHRQIVMDPYYTKNFCNLLCKMQESEACNEQMCPINCELGDFGPWSECDPCLRKQFRARTLTRPSQFGGQPCTEQLVDARRCSPAKVCSLEEVHCDGKFLCENGRCISRSLECNGENDCEDNSDERNCENVQPVCNRMHETIPGVQLMGLGFHLLAGESRGEVLGNSFNGGTCRLVKSKDKRKTFRVPANLEAINFQVENKEDDVESHFHSNLITLHSTSSKHNSSSRSGISSSRNSPLFWESKKTEFTFSSSFKAALKASYKKNSNVIRIRKVVVVSNFTVKPSDLQLSGVFLKALNSLPLEYNYALYSRIFDDFGTHYYTSGSMGGMYDLLYQFSAEKLKNSGLTEEEVSECVLTEVNRFVFFTKKKQVSAKCTNNSLTEGHTGSFLQTSEKSFSLVKGGRLRYASALAWEKMGSFPEHSVYTDWLESTKDMPIVVDFELASILDLVENFPCPVTKSRNLRRAFIEYMEKFDPCQCAPCPNNGKPVLSETECLCLCQAGTYGDNCEIWTSNDKSVAVDGYWSCWSAWSPCDVSHKRRRSRVCNNPSPLNGGRPCEGEQQQEGKCHLSVFADRGAICINDNEDAERESDVFIGQPASGCVKPDPPEHGFIRNEKNHYAVGDDAEVVCLSGYNLVGYPFLHCLPNQTWAQQLVECQYEQTGIQGNCSPGQKKVGSQCMCMSPAEDCGHYSEALCVLDSASERALTKSSCQYLAEKCLGDHPFHFLHPGPCSSDSDLSWAIERANISTRTTKREPCGYDTCYDWEKCSKSHAECFCLLPDQCPQDGTHLFCVRAGSRKMTANLCMLGALKCSDVNKNSCLLSRAACAQHQSILKPGVSLAEISVSVLLNLNQYK